MSKAILNKAILCVQKAVFQLIVFIYDQFLTIICALNFIVTEESGTVIFLCTCFYFFNFNDNILILLFSFWSDFTWKRNSSELWSRSKFSMVILTLFKFSNIIFLSFLGWLLLFTDLNWTLFSIVWLNITIHSRMC